MIQSFRHKGLRRLFETGNGAGVQASHTRRLRLQLQRAGPKVAGRGIERLPWRRLRRARGSAPLQGSAAGAARGRHSLQASRIRASICRPASARWLCRFFTSRGSSATLAPSAAMNISGS